MGFLGTSSEDRDQSWLKAYEKEDCPPHPDFPEPMVPDMTTQPYEDCRGCPQLGKDGHKSARCATLPKIFPAKHRISAHHLQYIDNIVCRLHWDARQPPYWDPSYVIMAGSGPYLSRWELRVVEAEGTQIVFETVTPGGNPWIAGPFGSSPQASDRVEPCAWSAMAGRSYPAVQRVEWISTTRGRLHVDRPVDYLMTPGIERAPLEPAPTEYRFNLVREAAERPKIRPKNPPTVLWSRKRILAMPAAAWPADKIFELNRANGKPGAIPWPDVYPDALKVEKRVAGEWTDISGDCRNRTRVNMQPIGPGEKAMGLTRTKLCLGTENWAGQTGLSDLLPLPETEAVRITYRAETKEGHGCPSYARCKHSILLPCGSDYGPGPGRATDSLGRKWMCKSLYYHNGAEWVQPSMIEHHVPNCSGYGMCDRFDPIDTAGPDEAVFAPDKSLSPWLREVAYATNTVVEQLAPGFPASTVRRSCRPSLSGLHGGKSLTSATGWHPTVQVIDWGVGFVGDMETTTVDGNTTLDPLWGAMYDARQDWGALEWDTPLNSGVLSRLWAARKDFRGVTMIGTQDPWGWDGRHFYRQSPRIRRDGGELAERRGPARWVQVRDCQLLVPAVGITVLDVDQDRFDSVAHIFSVANTETIGEFEAGGYIDIKRKVQAGKEPQEITTTAVVAAAVVSGSQVILYLENTPQVWTYVSAPQTEATVPFHAGGGHVQCRDNHKVDSHAHPDPTLGGLMDKIAPGDGLQFGGLESLDRFHEMIFVVDYVKAFAGMPAPNWGPGGVDPGDVAYTPGFSTAGKGRNRDAVWIRDESGRAAAKVDSLVGQVITVKRSWAVLYPVPGIEWRATEFLLDAYSTLVAGTDYLLWQGNGRLWIAKSWLEAKRSLGKNVWCFHSPREA